MVERYPEYASLISQCFAESGIDEKQPEDSVAAMLQLLRSKGFSLRSCFIFAPPLWVSSTIFHKFRQADWRYPEDASLIPRCFAESGVDEKQPDDSVALVFFNRNYKNGIFAVID